MSRDSAHLLYGGVCCPLISRLCCDNLSDMVISRVFVWWWWDYFELLHHLVGSLEVFPTTYRGVCWLFFPFAPQLLLLFSTLSKTTTIMATGHVGKATLQRVPSYHFPRHLRKFSSISGIASLWTSSLNLLVISQFLITRLLDFLGLKVILAQVAPFQTVLGTHLAWPSVGIVMMKSSKNPMIAGCWTPEVGFGLLVCFQADVMIRSIPTKNKPFPHRLPFCCQGGIAAWCL